MMEDTNPLQSTGGSGGMSSSSKSDSTGSGNEMDIPNQRSPQENGTCPFLEWVTFLGLAVLVFHLLALWYRWLRPDPEFLGFTASVAEILAIASFIGLQTERGRLVLDRLEDTAPAKRLLGTPKRACVTAWVAAVVAIVLLHAGSPLAARYFRSQGVIALEQGHYSAAIKDFQQAVSLVPEDARAHYNLASAYEALQNDEDAVAEYLIAIELDDGFWPSYNNLGHLYVQTLQKPDAALAILHLGLRQSESPIGEAVISKNIAWSYLEIGYPKMAISTLEEALSQLLALRDAGEMVEIYLAEAYRVNALALQSLDRMDEARISWQDSLGYALSISESEACTAHGVQPPPDCLDALHLAAEAREALLH
jgi:tetratricopeptide (TPR) repeat protein